MKKVIIASLAAIIASASTFADWECEGFYMGANVGVNFSELKMKAEGKTYNDGDTYGASDSGWTVVNRATDATTKTININQAMSFSHFFDDLMNKNTHKKKFLTEINFGYGFKRDKITAGIEMNVGINFGKTKVNKAKVGASIEGGERKLLEVGKVPDVRQNWYISLMPNIGYRLTESTAGYLTAGIKLAHWKLRVPNTIMGVLNLGGDIDLSNYPVMKSKNSVRITPVIGAGIRIDFNPKIFGRIEYNHEFKTSLKKSSSMAPEFRSFKMSGNIFKLGFGYKF